MPRGNVLNVDVQDFIKAIVAMRCKERIEPRSTRHFARIYRKLFSVTTKMPWELSTEDLERFLSLEHTDTKVEDATLVLAKIINENMLSHNCPLVPEIENTLTVRLAQSLYERKEGEKLPDKKTLY
jgi:hypothetical protein